MEELKSIKGLAVGVVRYFGTQQLVGITCGRLPQCYRSIARLTLHRHFHNQDPMEWEILQQVDHNIYGLAAGDTELILNVMEDLADALFDQVQKELNFDGFHGAAGEVLPRLQNLQADLSDNVVPIYRYPGNYSSDQWETFLWSQTSFKIKQLVGTALQPLVTQTMNRFMNRFVTNLYRDGNDFIAHHSDKDLDLNRESVIVSVSLGDERIMELKSRSEPKDVTRIRLPHRSMLVLGTKTNKQFSHSILPKEEI